MRPFPASLEGCPAHCIPFPACLSPGVTAVLGGPEAGTSCPQLGMHGRFLLVSRHHVVPVSLSLVLSHTGWFHISACSQNVGSSGQGPVLLISTFSQGDCMHSCSLTCDPYTDGLKMRLKRKRPLSPRLLLQTPLFGMSTRIPSGCLSLTHSKLNSAFLPTLLSLYPPCLSFSLS